MKANWIAVGRGVAFAVLSAVLAAPSALATVCDSPRTIALFANTSYVDYSTSAFSEASNMQASLEANGHTVVPFVATNGAGVAAALDGADVVVIPELERYFGDPFDAGARAEFEAFVDSGGVMIASYPYRSRFYLNDIFGWGLTYTGGGTSYYCASGAAGTPFDGSPGSLTSYSATGSYTTGSLPAGAQRIYTTSGPCVNNNTVVVMPYGDGYVVSLGWDWFYSWPRGPYDPGGAGWNRVLDLATCMANPAPPSGGTCDLSEIEAKLDDEFRFTDDDELREWRDEMNAQLAALEAKADEMTASYCDIVRLLHTPSGIRTADCGGQHYEWNDDGTFHD